MAIRAPVLVLGASVLAAALGWTFLIENSDAPGARTHPLQQPGASMASGDWARLMASPSPVPTGQSTAASAPTAGPVWRLVGVMASGDAGLALIAGADGAARVYRVGAVVHGDTVVQSVSAQQVRLGPRGGPASAVLEMPTAPASGGQPRPSAKADALPAADASNDTSPIVPPHADMPTPLAAESGTVGSRWNELRAKPPTP
jgi:hypothetical protein